MRLLIENCTVLAEQAEHGWLAGQHLLIEDQRIVSIGPERPDGPFDRVLPGARRLAIPGLVNAHTHSPENFMRATTDGLALEPWLVYLFGQSGFYSPRDIQLAILIGAAEMIRSGVTGVVDHLWMSPRPTLEHLEAGAAAYRDSGLRAAIAPLYRDAQYDIDYGIAQGHPLADTFFTRLLPGLPKLDEVLEILEAFIRGWHKAENGRLSVFVGPSGLQWCSEDLLRRSLDLARRYQTGFHMHLLETRIQRRAALWKLGRPGVQWLFERELLGPEVSLPHSVHLDQTDIECLARSGASPVHNPAANTKLGSGLAPIRAMLDAGVNVALGADGSASSDNQVLFEALRLAALIHNPGQPDPAKWISAREAWRLATEGGAQVLGLRGQLGQLRPGWLADIALLDLDHPHWTPLNDAYRQLAFCESGAAVRTVIVDGRIVMEDGRILAFDEAAILEEARQAAAARPFRRAPAPEVAEAIARFAAFQKAEALRDA